MSDIRHMKKGDQVIRVDIAQIEVFEGRGFKICDPPAEPKVELPPPRTPKLAPGLVRLVRGDGAKCICAESSVKVFTDTGWRLEGEAPAPDDIAGSDSAQEGGEGKVGTDPSGDSSDEEQGRRGRRGRLS